MSHDPRDITKCPTCGGEADNGFDRCDPPSPYDCSVCEARGEGYLEGREPLHGLAYRQSEWSQRTFGRDSDRGPVGAIKHLRDECDELLAAPTDPEEYADALLLILDASRRAGLSVDQLIAAATEKQTKNEAREWPDAAPDEPVYHKR